MATSAVPRAAPRPMAAGQAILVVLMALATGTLLNAEDIKATAERQPFGWRRTAALAAITPVHALSSALSLDRPRTAIDLALGRDPNSRTRTPDTAVAATPPPPAFAGAAEDEASPGPPPSRAVSAQDPLRLFIGGDSMVGQFGPVLANLADKTGMVQTEVAFEFASGLTRPDFVDWPTRLRDVGRQQDPEVVVLIFGGNDAQDLRVDGLTLEVGSPQWRAEYRQRVAAVMDELTAGGRRVFWIGMPIVRSETFQQRVRMLNDIYRTEAAAHAGITYVDSWDLFTGPDGRYSEYLLDPSGGYTDMRLNDGVHLTTAGARRLAGKVFGLISAEWPLSRPPPAAPPSP